MKKKVKGLICIALILVMSVGIIACGNGGGNNQAPAQAEPPAAEAEAPAAEAPAAEAEVPTQDAEMPRVAVLIPGPAGYFAAVTAGMERAAETYGLELIFADAGWDAGRQLSQVEDFIALGVDLIALCAADADAVIPAVEMANTAGVPILAFTNAIGDDPTGAFEGLVSYVGQSEVATGALCAEIAMDLLGPEGGRIVLLEGRPGTFPQRYRREGFLNAIADQPQMEIVFTQTTNWEMAEGMRIVEDLIQSGMEFDLIFAQDDNSAIGAGRALEEANMKDQVFVIGLGGSIDGLQALREGTIDATTFMSAEEEGFLAIQTAYSYLAGNPVNAVTEIVQVRVDSTNVDNFVGEW